MWPRAARARPNATTALVLASGPRAGRNLISTRTRSRRPSLTARSWAGVRRIGTRAGPERAIRTTR